MKLSLTERWILSNQCLILSKLYPEESKEHDKVREALDSGYELHYAPERITANPDEIMTAEECRAVLDILNMFQVLRQSFEKLSDKAGVEKSIVEFDGFDGNNETKQMGYVRFYCTLPGGRFENDVQIKNLNSHSPRLPRYRAMLSAYTRIKSAKPKSGAMDAYLFTKEEIIAVASVKPLE
jgi:uncharacterized protein YfbU (UPF0304 family)